MYKLDCCLAAKSWLTLCSRMDYSPPGSSVHGTSQARTLEGVAISFSRRPSWPRDRTPYLLYGRRVLYHWAIRETHKLNSLIQNVAKNLEVTPRCKLKHDLATPTALLGFLLPWTWGISSQLLEQSAAAGPYLGQRVSPHGCPCWPWSWGVGRIKWLAFWPLG